MSRTHGRPMPLATDPALSWTEAGALIAFGDPGALPWAIRIRPSSDERGRMLLRTAPVLTYSIDGDAHADVSLSPDQVPLVLRAVESWPLAATALALLLRTTEDASIPDALAAESVTYSTLQAGPEYADWLAFRGRPTPARSDGPVVRVADTDHGTRITLDRRTSANAIDTRTRAELYAAFRVVSAESRPVEWVGEGAHFCAGGDLSEFGTVSSPTAGHVLRMQQNLPLAVAEVRDRLTARVHGACIGAGMELSSFAHRVVATADTVWRLPEVTMGLLPGCGGTVSIPRRVGRQRALFLMLTNQVLDAATALEWGLIDDVVDA